MPDYNTAKIEAGLRAQLVSGHFSRMGVIKIEIACFPCRRPIMFAGSTGPQSPGIGGWQ